MTDPNSTSTTGTTGTTTIIPPGITSDPIINALKPMFDQILQQVLPLILTAIMANLSKSLGITLPNGTATTGAAAATGTTATTAVKPSLIHAPSVATGILGIVGTVIAQAAGTLGGGGPIAPLVGLAADPTFWGHVLPTLATGLTALGATGGSNWIGGMFKKLSGGK